MSIKDLYLVNRNLTVFYTGDIEINHTDLESKLLDRNTFAGKKGRRNCIKELGKMVKNIDTEKQYNVIYINDIYEQYIKIARDNNFDTLVLYYNDDTKIPVAGFDSTFVHVISNDITAETLIKIVNKYLVEPLPDINVRKELEPLYISAKLLPKGVDKLKKLIESENDKIDEVFDQKFNRFASLYPMERNNKDYCDHVTFIHSNSLSLDTYEGWKYLKTLIGKVVTMTISKLHFDENNFIFEVDDIINESNESNESLKEYVYSNIPHITGRLPKYVSPVASIKLLKEKKLDYCIPLNIVLDAIIS